MGEFKFFKLSFLNIFVLLHSSSRPKCKCSRDDDGFHQRRVSPRPRPRRIKEEIKNFNRQFSISRGVCHEICSR